MAKKGVTVCLVCVVTSLAMCGAVRAEEIKGVGANVTNNIPPGRLVVSILWFENRAGSQAEHWCYGIEGVLQSQIRQVKSIRLRGGVEYARRKMGIEEGSALNTEQARKIGEIIEAQRVIWGSYQRQDDKWKVSLYLLNVATGAVSDPLTAASTDWYDIRDKLTEQILEQLKIRPSEDEQKKLIRRETTSPQALEWYTKAYALQFEGGPLSEQEECERRAIAADPQFAKAYAGLASVLFSQGEFEQAEEMARRALEIKPDDAQPHLVLGIIQSHQKNDAEAEIEFNKVLRLEPDNAMVLGILAQLYSVQGKLDEAIIYDEKAIILEPMGAGIHAHLGLAYARKRDRDKAMAALKEAERLIGPEGLGAINTEQMLCLAYELLGEVPLAVEHYERFVALARKQGLNPKLVSAFEQKVEVLKATLTPTFIEAPAPKSYTEQTLQEELRKRLTAEELQMVVNPVASSPQIERWAEELTEGAGSEFDKARAISDGLTRRIKAKGRFGARTARDVFAAWSEPDEAFSCQEYTKLYVALARDVNVQAFYVHVDKVYDDSVAYHDCAAVFVEGKVLLVDPLNRWFGAPHKEFIILDDLQTIAHHFFQGKDVSRCRLAAKLHPNYAWGQLKLAKALILAKQIEESRKAVDTAARLEPGRWDIFRLKGLLAADDRNLDLAEDYLRQALELNPEDSVSHYNLGLTLATKAKLKEAREEFRACVRYDSTNEIAEKAQLEIVQINEMIGSGSAQEYDTAALILASRGGHTETVRRLLAEGTGVNAKDNDGMTALMCAAYRGYTDIVKALLESKADVNVENKEGMTALWQAAQNGHVEVVKLLLESKADVNAKDKTYGVTALWVAAQNGHVEVAKLLLKSKADVNAKDKTYGVTALWQVVEKGHTEVVKVLLEKGADVNAPNAVGVTALMVAALNGHTDIVKALLEKGADVNAPNAVGATALTAACDMGHTDIVKALLEAKADVNIQSKTDGVTALRMAAGKGHVEIVKLLLESKADVNIQSKTDGVTALWMAAGKGHVEIIKLLLESKADANVKDKTNGFTALMMAAQNGHTEIVKTLLEAKADVNIQSKTYGATALMVAAQYGHTDIVKALLEKGADVNAPNAVGATALMVACEIGHTDIVKLLLESNADVNIQRKTDGVTALYMAAQDRHLEIVKALLEKGADVNAKEKTDGVTALWQAAQNGHTETIKVLLEAKADVNIQRKTDGVTALWQAAWLGHTEVVKALLEAKADVNAKDTDGVTTLYMAAQQGHLDIVKALLEKGAEVNTANTVGVTALMAAALDGHTDIVKLLLENKADVNVKDKTNGATALMVACEKGNTETAGLLLDRGAVVNARNHYGVTALMAACEIGHTDIVKLLLESKADVTVNAMGPTALKIARRRGHAEIVELLTKSLQSKLSTWLSEGMPISQSELLEYYEQVKAERFIKNAKLHIQLIDIRPSNLNPSQIKASEGETGEEAALRIATQLCERIRKGEDFGELAETYSHGHRRSYGGLWYPFTPGSLASPYDVLEEHARNVQLGQVSEPIQKNGHVFVLKLEKRVQKSVQLLNEVKDTLEEELRILKRKKLEEAIHGQ